jgi:regulatory protein YycI of two-component signal transduction system YycFG
MKNINIGISYGYTLLNMVYKKQAIIIIPKLILNIFLIDMYFNTIIENRKPPTAAKPIDVAFK